MRFFIQTFNRIVAIMNMLLVISFMWFFSMILFGGMDGAAAITRVVDTMGLCWDGLISLVMAIVH